MEGVSDFIVGTCTCKLYHKSYNDVFESKQFPYYWASPYEVQHHFQCGSSVEIYIKPMNSCIDDVDFMMFNPDELAFTEDIPVLPDDIRGFLDNIECSHIIPYPNFPGFVELRHLGNLRYNWNCKQFEFQQTDDLEQYLVSEVTLNENVREHCVVGPALKLKLEFDVHNDIVPCIWCPQWPKQANHWPRRRRYYGWPTSDNIRNIVQNGCHVVFAKHPACKDDEFQWRLSFSGAELCLLQSWTPVQQIVYHMLRFFAKREIIRKDCPKVDKVLCTYHFKTLMMWSCEEKSPEWWNSSSVIEICCNLLQKLSEWLKKKYCANYFIPQANLFHEGMNQKIVDETIRRLNKFCHFYVINDWFTVKYIKPILERVFAFEDIMETVEDFEYYTLRIIEIMDAGKLKNFDSYFLNGIWYCAMYTFREVMVKRSYNFRGYMNFLFCLTHSSKEINGSFQSSVEFSLRFPQFGKVLFILHAAFVLAFHKTTYDSDIFSDFIREISLQQKVLRSKHHNFPKPSETRLARSCVFFQKAQDLMENLTGLNSLQEIKLVSQLSKELLRNASYFDDSEPSAIRDVAFLYMAALHFSESDYETVIDLSSTVFINRTSGEEEKVKNEEMDKVAVKETLNAGCLFYIDEVVRIIGFYLLFRRIQDNFQYNRRWYLVDLRLTPEVFAHHLIILSSERRNKVIRLNYDLHTPAFPLDEILMTITNRKSKGISKNSQSFLRVYQRTEPSSKITAPNKRSLPSEDNIIQLLMEYSIENMTSFYDAICTDFGIHCNTGDCYRAAYLHKCRKYPEALHLCERILIEPDLENNLKEFTFANVMVLPPLDSYFDTDIQCLLGFQTLVNYVSPLNEDLGNLEPNDDFTFQHFFARRICTEKRLLSAALRCCMKFHYFLERHFLARYLKLRCLIDCNHSDSEVMFEFKKLKSTLPFEHIIHAFLLKTLCQL